MDEIVKLILRVRNGEDVAFSLLCEQYQPLLNSMSGKYSSMNPDEQNVLEDFSQEARLALYNAAMKYDIDSSRFTFGAFAKACIRNRLVSCIRRANSKKRQKLNDGDDLNESTLQDTVIQHELEKERLYLAEKVLSNYEMRIFMMYAQGEKAKEISAKIGKSEKSVNNAIFRIRSKLKKQSKNGT